MKKLITLIFLAVAFLGYSQDDIDWDKYKIKVAWKTTISNVQYVNTDTFTVVVAPIDDDPGTFPLRYGNFLMDVRGLRYEIIDTTSAPTLTVVDILNANYAPFQGEPGFVYLSAGNGGSPSLPTVNFEQLNPDALQYGYGVDMNILWDRMDSLVPYRGAIRDVDLDTFGIKFGFFSNDTTYVPTGLEQKGTSFWDNDNNTMSTVMGNGVIYQWAKEAYIDGQNDTGVEIPNGTPVMYAGSIGNSGNFRITPGIASSTSPAFLFIGVTTEPIQDGEVGKITTRGKARGIPTDGTKYGEVWSAADIVYESGTTAGFLTNVAPQAPIPAIPVALVISAHATNGTLEVRPTYPQKLTELSDVDGTPLDSTGQFPVWNNDLTIFDFNYNINDYLRNPLDSATFIPKAANEIVADYSIFADSTEFNLSVKTGLGDFYYDIGQHQLLLYYNNTGDTIFKTKVLYHTGTITIDNVLHATAGLADASNWETTHGVLSVSLHKIPPNSFGWSGISGYYKFQNTLGLTPNEHFYLSADGSGDLINTSPVHPDFSILMGEAANSSADSGVVLIAITNDINDIYKDAWDGSIQQTFDFRTFVDGGVVKGVLTNTDNPGDVLRVNFSDGLYDFTVPDTINLTVGTAGPLGVIQDNFVYIDKTTKLLTVSTSAFPDTENSAIAVINLSDVTNTILTGAVGNQNINNHIKSINGNGHLIHSFERERARPAEWAGSGLATTLTVGSGSLQWDMTGGEMWQFHKQTLAAIDMATGSYMLINNDPDYPLRPVTDAGYLTKYSDGTTWNNKWAIFTVWVIGNKTGESSHLVLNLSRNGYTQEQDAIDDAQGYADYTIPDRFKTKGTFLGRYIIRRSGSTFTFNLSTGYLDLRPSDALSNVSGGSGVTDYTQLNQTPATLTALAFQRVDATGVTLENVLAEDILLSGFDSTGFTLTQSQIVGLVDTISDHRTDIDQNTSDIIANEIDYGTAFGEIPSTNATFDGFDYTTGFKWDGFSLIVPGAVNGSVIIGSIALQLLDKTSEINFSPGSGGFWYEDGIAYTRFESGTIFDLTGDRTPTTHAASHQNGGSDEISVAGLSGVLTDNQPFDDTGLVPYTGAATDVDLGGFDFDADTANFSGYLGVGINATELVHLFATSPVLRIDAINGNAAGGKIRFTEQAGYQGAYLHYDGSANKFHIGVHAVVGEILGDDVVSMTIDRSSAAVDFPVPVTAASLNAINLTTGFIPYDNGTSLVSAPISITGTSVSVGGSTTSTEVLEVYGTAPNLMIRSSDGSIITNQKLGGIYFDARDNTSTVDASVMIESFASQDHSSGAKGGYLVISTKGLNVDPDQAATERLRIDLDGNVVVTKAVTAASLNANDGATGSFTTVDGKTVTVTNGIIVSIL